MNYFNYENGANYPVQGKFSPEEQYLEYPFKNEEIVEKNDVYRMIRDCRG